MIKKDFYIFIYNYMKKVFILYICIYVQSVFCCSSKKSLVICKYLHIYILYIYIHWGLECLYISFWQVWNVRHSNLAFNPPGICRPRWIAKKQDSFPLRNGSHSVAPEKGSGRRCFLHGPISDRTLLEAFVGMISYLQPIESVYTGKWSMRCSRKPCHKLPHKRNHRNLRKKLHSKC